MDADEFRRHGKEMVDYVANYLENIRDRRVFPDVQQGYLRHLIPDHAPEEGEQWKDVLKDIERVIMPGVTHWHSPHFHAYYGVANSYSAVVADILSIGIGSVGFTWASNPASTELEVVVLDWLGKMLNLPEEFLSGLGSKGGGVIQSTASEATLVALLSARAREIRNYKKQHSDEHLESGEIMIKFVAYCSDQILALQTTLGQVRSENHSLTDTVKWMQGRVELCCSNLPMMSNKQEQILERLVSIGNAVENLTMVNKSHSSVERAGLIAAVTTRCLPTDEECSLRGHTLLDAINKDKAQGRIPIYVCATLGTTSSCAFDNITELGTVCEKEGIWMHIDAAYAGSAFICPEFRTLLDGVQFAESFNFNPHKWLNVNFHCSAMWVRNSDLITDAFKVDPIYLKHDSRGNMPDYMHWQIPFGSQFRSLKLWIVLRMYGLKGLQEYIRKDVKLAHEFEEFVRADDRFDIFGKVVMGLVCFRLKKQNYVNEVLLKAINADGRIHMVPSFAKGVYFLRFAICASSTNSDDVKLDWMVIQEVATKVIEDNKN